MEIIKVEPKKCLPCERSFNFNEEFLIKMPEWACFCMSCIEKYPDNNVYSGEWEWWLSLEFLPGMIITNDTWKSLT